MHDESSQARAESELDAALAAFRAAAPPRLTDRVMARLSATPQRAPEWAPAPTLDWWVRAAAEPASVLALLVAALMAWRPGAMGQGMLSLAQFMIGGARSIIERMGVPAAAAPFAAPLSNPRIVLALTLTVLPAVLWASWRLFRWAERVGLPAQRTARLH